MKPGYACPVCGDEKANLRGLGDLCLNCCYEVGFDDVDSYRVEWAVMCGLGLADEWKYPNGPRKSGEA